MFLGLKTKCCIHLTAILQETLVENWSPKIRVFAKIYSFLTTDPKTRLAWVFLWLSSLNHFLYFREPLWKKSCFLFKVHNPSIFLHNWPRLKKEKFNIVLKSLLVCDKCFLLKIFYWRYFISCILDRWKFSTGIFILLILIQGHGQCWPSVIRSTIFCMRGYFELNWMQKQSFVDVLQNRCS